METMPAKQGAGGEVMRRKLAVAWQEHYIPVYAVAPDCMQAMPAHPPFWTLRQMFVH